MTDDVTLSGTTATLRNTIDSDATARDLTVNATTTTFQAALGSNSALDVLTTDAAGTTSFDTTTLKAAKVALGDDVVLDQSLTMTVTDDVTIGGSLNSATGETNALVINGSVATTDVLFSGHLGDTDKLSSLTINPALSVTASKSITVTGDITLIADEVEIGRAHV